MSGSVGTGPIVVGVQLRQPDAVVEVAAALARRLSTGLVCVTVDPSRLVVGVRPDGSDVVEPIDPDVGLGVSEAVVSQIRRRVEGIGAAHGVRAETVSRVGDPTRELARAADERDAVMIVVGSRSGRHRVGAFFNGSIAARLAHQQHRPVLVLPTDPTGFGEPLPWIDE